MGATQLETLGSECWGPLWMDEWVSVGISLGPWGHGKGQWWAVEQIDGGFLLEWVTWNPKLGII